MDCFGLQALSDSSESEVDESLLRVCQNDDNMSIDGSVVEAGNIQNEPSREEKRELLYEQYKDGLKILMTGEYEDAEKIFEQILVHSYLEEIKDEELDEPPVKALIHIKYIILKNLASINTKYKTDLAKALNYLIQAAKIDSSDLCLWFDIGQNSLTLERFQISKLAFEQSLRIDSSYWPSLDNFIILVYALGNYSLCLKYIFKSLTIDKFYINGVILMKKIQLFEEAFYSQQIELFIDTNYNCYGIDLNEFLENSPESYYDDLFQRIDSIKLKVYEKLIRNKSIDTLRSGREKLTIPKKLSTWSSLGNFLMNINESDENNFQIPLTIEIEKEVVKEVSVETGSLPDRLADNKLLINDEKREESTVAVVVMSSTKSMKRKKIEQSSSDDSWWKRRSSRKGVGKCEDDAEAELKITNILKKFFDENYLKENNEMKNTSFNKKTPSINDFLSVNNVLELKDNESKAIESMLDSLSHKERIYNIIKLYLKNLSYKFDMKWPADLEEIYINLFNSFNTHYDLFEALTRETDKKEFLDICSILLVYVEIEYSKFKEILDKHVQKHSKRLNEQSIEKINNRYIHKLIFYYQQLETYFETYLLENGLEFNEFSGEFKQFRFFGIRISCLGLFSSLNITSGTISTEYYVNKIKEHLEITQTTRVVVANSKIFPVLSNEAIKDFIKQNKKNQILQLNDQIESMFKLGSFQEIIDHTEEFAENHKLSLKDVKFDPLIYIHLIRSYYSLDNFDKCFYFCRKFLKHIIKHFNEQLSLFNMSQPKQDSETKSITILESDSSSDSDYQGVVTPKILSFVSNILELILDIFKVKRSSITSCSNTLSSSSQSQFFDSNTLHDVVWMMYQLISMFFDNHEANLKYFVNSFRPVKVFMIIFYCMSNNTKLERVRYISLAHAYLAKYNVCSGNRGEFLIWSIQTLMDYTKKCEICNQLDTADDEDTEPDSSNPQTLDDKSGSDIETKEKSKQKSQKTYSQDYEQCEACDECSYILEQSFFCFFGYKKPRNKYVESHICDHIPYSLENCVHLYNYFKPDELPEYDDLPQKKSIPPEFNEFCFEVTKLLQKSDDQGDLISLQDKFIAVFQTENYNELTALINSMKRESTDEFHDIYYLMADYTFKTEKDFSKKEATATKYYIKDVTYNSGHFDSWTALALTKQTVVLEEYLEKGFNLNTESQVEDFLKAVYITINLFRKAVEMMSDANDHKLWIEYGAFLYQIHSYCSRQLKLDKIVKHFSELPIRSILEKKRLDFLNLALDAYVNANAGNIYNDHGSEEINNAEDTGSSSSSDNQTTRKKEISKKAQVETVNEDENTEQWLHHYMLGKIKEKLTPMKIMNSLEHYFQSLKHHENNGANYLKRLTYKTKGYLSIESNEVYYRIYGLTLKRLDSLALKSTSDEFISLQTFLESVIDTKFVKAHNDFQLEEISPFLNELMSQKFKRISEVSNKEAFLKCICICVAGLNQILRRFTQHYRSLYRLAFFYSKFLDIRCYKYSKNLLLGLPSWQNLSYMTSPGLFQERNKVNYFNGIYRISSNSNKDQDLERGGSFFHHIFEAIKLLIEVLERTNDFTNLIELSRCLYLKPDQDRKYLEDSQREFFANLSLLTSFNILTENLDARCQQETEMNLIDLIPILLDSYEVYKLSTKHYSHLNASIEILLNELYLKFQPERRNNVTNDELIKFCKQIELKDKADKAAKAKASSSKPRARNSLSQTFQSQQ